MPLTPDSIRQALAKCDGSRKEAKESLMKLFSWIYWALYYAIHQKPQEFAAILERDLRLIPPWRSFRPYIYRNDDGQCWEIWLANDSSHSKAGWVYCDIAIGRSNNEIVGLTLFDEAMIATTPEIIRERDAALETCTKLCHRIDEMEDRNIELLARISREMKHGADENQSEAGSQDVP